jgi:uncharacterized protein (TIGR02452 family)
MKNNEDSKISNNKIQITLITIGSIIILFAIYSIGFNKNNKPHEMSYKDIATDNISRFKDEKTISTNIKFTEYKDKDNTHYERTKIIFKDMYTDDAIMEYQINHNKVVALNFANAVTQGGGYVNGASAQEEALCRQYPLLYNSLLNIKPYKLNTEQIYDIEKSSIIYSDNIPRHRNTQTTSDIIDPPVTIVNFISAAAPCAVNFIKLEKYIKIYLQSVIQTCYKTAISKNNTHFITGAFGCGMFAPTNISFKNKYVMYIATTMIEAALRYSNDIITIIAVPSSQHDNNNAIFKQKYDELVSKHL